MGQNQSLGGNGGFPGDKNGKDKVVINVSLVPSCRVFSVYSPVFNACLEPRIDTVHSRCYDCGGLHTPPRGTVLPGIENTELELPGLRAVGPCRAEPPLTRRSSIHHRKWSMLLSF